MSTSLKNGVESHQIRHENSFSRLNLTLVEDDILDKLDGSVYLVTGNTSIDQHVQQDFTAEAF